MQKPCCICITRPTRVGGLTSRPKGRNNLCRDAVSQQPCLPVSYLLTSMHSQKPQYRYGVQMLAALRDRLTKGYSCLAGKLDYVTANVDFKHTPGVYTKPLVVCQLVQISVKKGGSGCIPSGCPLPRYRSRLRHRLWLQRRCKVPASGQLPRQCTDTSAGPELLACTPVTLSHQDY